MSEWISVEDRLPEYSKHVLALFITNQGNAVQSVARVDLVTQHAFENSPMHDRWYVYPSWGHEIKPTHWMPLPEVPTS